ncbi:hypothetical protein JCM10207_005918 [Rhodosporidiobolus poonsookiae]
MATLPVSPFFRFRRLPSSEAQERRRDQIITQWLLPSVPYKDEQPGGRFRRRRRARSDENAQEEESRLTAALVASAVEGDSHATTGSDAPPPSYDTLFPPPSSPSQTPSSSPSLSASTSVPPPPVPAYAHLSDPHALRTETTPLLAASDQPTSSRRFSLDSGYDSLLSREPTRDGQHEAPNGEIEPTVEENAARSRWKRLARSFSPHGKPPAPSSRGFPVDSSASFDPRLTAQQSPWGWAAYL